MAPHGEQFVFHAAEAVECQRCKIAEHGRVAHRDAVICDHLDKLFEEMVDADGGVKMGSVLEEMFGDSIGLLNLAFGSGMGGTKTELATRLSEAGHRDGEGAALASEGVSVGAAISLIGNARYVLFGSEFIGGRFSFLRHWRLLEVKLELQ